MPGLPASIIKKHGVSKKAWQEFRRMKSKKRSTKRLNRTPPQRTTMARRRRRSSRRSRSRSFKGSAFGGGTSGKLVRIGIGVGAGFAVQTAINSIGTTLNFPVGTQIAPIVGAVTAFAAVKGQSTAVKVVTMLPFIAALGLNLGGILGGLTGAPAATNTTATTAPGQAATF